MVADQQGTACGGNVLWAENGHPITDTREQPQERSSDHLFHAQPFGLRVRVEDEVRPVTDKGYS
jgi:hypothetical protein